MGKPKTDSAPQVALYQAMDTFIVGGSTVVEKGDIAVAGHPILKGRAHLFEALTPRFAGHAPAGAGDADGDPASTPTCSDHEDEPLTRCETCLTELVAEALADVVVADPAEEPEPAAVETSTDPTPEPPAEASPPRRASRRPTKPAAGES